MVVTIDRPEVRNAVDGPTARSLAEAFDEFEHDPRASVAILTGAGGNFCAGADLKAVADGRGNPVLPEGNGPMGPTRMMLSKPVIAAIEGYAVAGGFELALWCDLRVASRQAVFGIFNRRWGVPLVDGGTFRLPRIVGLGRALDLILTGRPIYAEEARDIGLVTLVTEAGRALEEAVELAKRIARFPQKTLNADRLATYESSVLGLPEAISVEYAHGIEALRSGEALEGARKFSEGSGRHGSFDDQ
jgi:enoyl-CoA hydratase